MVTTASALITARSFIRECQLNGLNFQKIVLFGSTAKGKANEWSDIDLLLISDQFTNNLFDNLKMYASINIKYPKIETHPYPTQTYLDGDDFIRHICSEGFEISA